MNLQHRVSKDQAAGMLVGESDKSYHLRPVEYVVDSDGHSVYPSTTDGLWLDKEAWEVI